MSCPGNTMEVSTPRDCGAQVNYTEPFAEIAVRELRQIQHNYTSQSFFEVGRTTVYYKAQNNSHFCIFIVEVADNEKPNFIEFLEDIEVETVATSVTTVKWEEPEVQDNCVDLTMASSYASGDVFPLGKTVLNSWLEM